MPHRNKYFLDKLLLSLRVQEVMQDERMHFKASAKRDTPVKENQRLFQLLLKGDKEAEPYCLRAKAQYDSTNGERRRFVLEGNVCKIGGDREGEEGT